jgi:outer membrane protein
MIYRRRTFLVVLLLAATSCVVDQKKEVEQYRVELDAKLLGGESDYVAGGPLSVRQALTLANAQNERLAIEGENYLQSLIERRRATAAFLPTINLAPSFLIREKVPGGDNDSTTNSRQDQFLDVPVHGGANVFNGFSDLARVRRSARTIEERRNLLLDLQEAVLLDTATVYYNVLRAERSADVLTNSLAVQDARVRDIKGRQKVGTARPLDVAQTEAQASATRVLLINAQNDVRNGRTALVFVTAADAVHDAKLIERFDAPLLPSMDELKVAAAARRRDLQAANAAVLAARQNVEVAFGQYYPSVTLDVNVFLYRESVPDARTWDALLRANLPIFSAGLIEADVRQAWSFYRQAALNESLLRRQVMQDVEIAYQNVAATEQRIAELNVQLSAAQQAFNQADQSYNVGLATNLERVTAQDQLLSAQLQLTSARFDRTLAYLSLARSAGILRQRLEQGPATQTTTRLSN